MAVPAVNPCRALPDKLGVDVLLPGMDHADCSPLAVFAFVLDATKGKPFVGYPAALDERREMVAMPTLLNSTRGLSTPHHGRITLSQNGNGREGMRIRFLFVLSSSILFLIAAGASA